MRSLLRRLVSVGLLPASGAYASELPTATNVLRETGVSAGLAVVVGTADETLEAGAAEWHGNGAKLRERPWGS